MYVVDAIVVLLAVVAGYTGWRVGGVRQTAAFVGLIVGLFGAAFAYTKLAFLADQSWLRSGILVVLSLAITLLSWDAFLAFGKMLQERVKLTSTLQRRVSAGIGCAVGVVGAILVLWIVAIVPGRVGPGAVRVYINQSALLTTTNRVLPSPELFQTVAYLTAPFSSPTVFVGVEPTFATTVQSQNIEQAYNRLDTAIAAATPGVVKVSSWGCGGTTVGSGFIVAKQYIVTNAHVVAGANRISVLDASGATAAVHTVAFDSGLDVAVLYATAPLAVTPLRLNVGVAAPGSVAAVLGYPNGGDFAAGDATILQDMQASGTDIYGKQNLTRHIYAVRSSVVPGNSGGPLLGADGRVLGIILGHSNTQNRTGYVLAADQMTKVIDSLANSTQKINTGQCETQ